MTLPPSARGGGTSWRDKADAAEVTPPRAEGGRVMGEKVCPSDYGIGRSKTIHRPRDLMRANDFYATVLAMASHDLRQPLQIVSAQELLARRLIASPEREHLERSERASAHLAEQLDQLVDALHLHQSTGRIRPEPVRFEPILEHLALQLEGPARRKGVDLGLFPTRAVILTNH